jgi:Predicted naringenin-chalcone synthase
MTQINGLGTALPKNSFSQEECLNHALKFSAFAKREEQVLRRLYSRTDIDQRGSCIAERVDELAVASFFHEPESASDRGPGTADRMRRYNQFAKQLSLASSMNALKNARTNAQDITHLVTVSCTGFGAPGFDINLARELNLSNNIFRTHVGFMGCHGTLNALRVAQGFLAAQPQAKVLLCSTEICSVHFQYGKNTWDVVSNSLFADGSAALVLSNSEGRCSYQDSRSSIVPNTEDAMTWNIGDHGFTMSLSPNVPSLIEEYLPLALKDWLATHDLLIEEIASWAVHPGGPRVLDAVQRSLALDSDAMNASRNVLSRYGNMSSPTVLFILDKLLKSENPLPCVALAFGPGLTLEAALFV